MSTHGKITPGGIAISILCLAALLALASAAGDFNDGRGQVRSGSVSSGVNTPFVTQATGGETRLLISTTLALVAGDTTTTINPTTAWELVEVRLHLSANATTTTPFLAQIDHGSGVEFDTVVISESMQNDADLVIQFDPPMNFRATDSVTFSFLNDDSDTVGLEAMWRALP